MVPAAVQQLVFEIEEGMLAREVLVGADLRQNLPMPVASLILPSVA